MHDVDRRVGQRHLLCGAGQQGDVREGSGTAGGQAQQPGMRLDAVHASGGLGEAREVEAGAAAEVEHDAALPVGTGAHGLLEEAVAVDGVVLQLVRRGVLPDVGTRDRTSR